MAIQDVLRWHDGAGWLVLSGGNDALSDIRAMALSRAKSDGGVAYIGLHEDDNEDIIEDMADLGAPTGYLVNIRTEDDDTIKSRIQDASLIVIPDEYDPEIMYSALVGSAFDTLRQAYEDGKVILVEGQQIALFGKLFMLDDETTKDAFDVVENTLILSDVIQLGESELAIEILEAQLVTVALGIGVGSALVLGQNKQLEIWGEGQVSIALGRT